MWHSWSADLHKLYLLAFPHNSWCNWHMTGWDVTMGINVFTKILRQWMLTARNMNVSPSTHNITILMADYGCLSVRPSTNPTQVWPKSLTSKWKLICNTGIISDVPPSVETRYWEQDPIFLSLFTSVKVEGCQEMSGLMPEHGHIKGTPGKCAIWQACPVIFCCHADGTYIKWHGQMPVIKLLYVFFIWWLVEMVSRSTCHQIWFIYPGSHDIRSFVWSAINRNNNTFQEILAICKRKKKRARLTLAAWHEFLKGL